MSNCQSCKSDRIINVSGKVSDMFNAQIGENDYSGYVSGDLGIGSGDYIEFGYCADCGQIQGDFPLHKTEIENGQDENNQDGFIED